MIIRGLRFSVLLLWCGACLPNREQSALDPAGPLADGSRQMLEVMLPIAALVYLLVIAALYLGLRRRSADSDPQSPTRERSARRMVIGAVTATVVVLFAVLIYDLTVAHRLAHPPAGPVISIRLTGHQWWWEVEYQDTVAQKRVLLANEIHIPVGRAVRIELISHDVIHSFWVPNLAGKKDLIPGHDNSMWLRADRPGQFRSPCAEFCGAEHAKMALMVVAESQPEFEAWLARQRQPANLPAESLAAEGRALFEAGQCAGCHTVRGTPAGGRLGPNLTHIASRLTLGAGVLPNTAARLSGWIQDPQGIKPGAQMPVSGLTPAQIKAVVAYLETLR